MANTIAERMKHAWNAFMNKDPTKEYIYDIGPSYSSRPDRPKFVSTNERSIVNAIYNRIALDVAAVDIQHAKLDENNRYLEPIDDGLNKCLNLSANKDQTGRAFKQDLVMSMFDEGVVVALPIDTDYEGEGSEPAMWKSYEIETIRTAKVVEWYPDHVKLKAYNDRKGVYEERTFKKSAVAIIENPLYSVMNAPNSTLKRLIRKLNLLDVVDEQAGSGKLDLIIQLPYVIKTPAQRNQAERRRKDIETQLNNSKYGIAYTDGTERITQLNRAVENNLLKTVDYLTNLLYSQLGISASVFDGTADEKTMLNYYNRTIEPILSAIVDEMKRKFLTDTARSQRQSLVFYRDPFRLVPVEQLAEIADKLARNEIMTSNEIRQVVGMKPSKDPKADQLRNSNLSESADVQQYDMQGNPVPGTGAENNSQ